MKKRIALITAVMLLVMSFPFMAMATETGDKTYEDGNFVYRLTDGSGEQTGTAEVIEYKGKKTETKDEVTDNSDKVVIPETITVTASGQVTADLDAGTEYQVTAIGARVFENNRYITAVEMPDTITSIGENAFNCCTKLQTVVLSNQLVILGENAFFSCTRLQSVQIRTTADSGGQSGGDASSAEDTDVLSGENTVTLPESLTTLGDGAFYDCQSIEAVSIEGTLDLKRENVDDNYGDYAFGVCAKLETVNFEKAPDIISNQMFANCGALQEIDLPEGITSIGNSAFSACRSLFSGASLELPDSLDSIGDRAFYHCDTMEKVSIPNCTIGDDAFGACFALNEVVFTGEGEPPSGTEPDIGMRAFTYADLETIELPAYVDKIDGGAFFGCGLSSITVHDANTQFKSVDGVLMNKAGTELIAYPAGKEADSYAIPGGVTDVGMGAFAGNETLKNVTLPDGLKSIGSAAFEGCCNLTAVSIPNTVTTMEDWTFYGCENMETVDLPNGLETIEKGLFEGCHTLEGIDIPDSVKSIEDSAFASCYSLNDVDIPASVINISPLSFSYCGSLENLDIDSGNASFSMKDGILYDKAGKKLLMCLPAKAVESFAIPDGTTSIGTNAFSANTNIRNVTVPASITNIEDDALGFMIISGDGLKDKAAGFYISSPSGNDAVKTYANGEGIAYFTGTPSANKESVSLKAGETFTFIIENAPDESLLYTSSDESIATVDRRTGEITGVSEGETYVTACTGTMTFLCKVTVTSGDKPTVSGTEYRLLATDEIPAWAERYNDYNKDIFYAEKLDNSNLLEYSSNNYIAILAKTQGGKYITQADRVFGEGGYEQYKNIADNLSLEIGRYKQNENLVVFRGTSDTSQYTTARTSELEDMYATIGETVKTGNKAGEDRYAGDWVASTSVDRNVSLLFASDSSTATMLEIYAPKGYLKGAYINNFSIFDEAEILLDGGTEFKVIDAGVRIVELPTGEDDGEPWLKPERYMKLQITGAKGESFTGLGDPVVVTSGTEGVQPKPDPYKIKVDKDVLTITRDLMETEDFNTEEKIKTALYNKLMEVLGSDAFNMDNTVIWDIKAVDKDNNIVPSTELPRNGIKIVIPYPDQVKGDWENCDFTILHMFGENRGVRATAGDIEGPLVHKKTEAGLEVTVYSMSPFAIHWSKKDAAKDDTGAGEEDKDQGKPDGEKDVAGGEENDSGKSGEKGSDTDTGDTFNMTPWIVAMILTAAAIAALLGVMFRKPRKQ